MTRTTEQNLRTTYAKVRTNLYPAPRKITRFKTMRSLLRTDDPAIKALFDSFKVIDVVPWHEATREERVASIKDEVAQKYGVTVAILDGTCRKRPYVLARQECATRIHHEVENMSLAKIGQAMGGRDHSTIRNAIDRHEERMAA